MIRSEWFNLNGPLGVVFILDIAEIGEMHAVDETEESD